MNGRNRNHSRQVFARSRNEPPSLSPSEPRPPFGKASHGPRLVRRAARVLRSSISDRGRYVAAGATGRRRRRSNMTNLRIRRPPFFNVRLWVGFADFAVRLLPPRALRPRARGPHIILRKQTETERMGSKSEDHAPDGPRFIADLARTGAAER